KSYQSNPGDPDQRFPIGADPAGRASWPPCRASRHERLGGVPLIGHLGPDAELDAGVQRHVRNPQGDAHMFAALFEYFQQQIGRAVENLRVVAKSGGAVYITFETHDAADSLQVASG